MTLARKFRLKGKKEFQEIKEKGKLIQTPFFSLLVLETKEKNGPKFGFVVSRKIDPRAVARNRIRRLLREAAKTFSPKLRRNLKIIFLAKTRLKQASLKEIIKILEKIKIPCGNKSENMRRK